MHRFDVIEKVVQDPDVIQDNVNKIDQTGMMLSKPKSIKVIVGKGNKGGSRGPRVDQPQSLASTV